ncbi:MAG: hypothetical protein KJO77_02625, partial [Bacteroidia bacterium]|nr:hypothetical protein [Bacteroidia bacterium]
MLSIYVVSSWVILQVLSVTYQPLGLPEKSVTILIMLLLVGFPIYIFYIWRSRLKYTVSTDIEDAVEVRNRKVFEHFFFSGFGVISFFCALAVLLIVNTNFVDDGSIPEFESSGKIAVLTFDNNTGQEKFDGVSKMTLDWIQHGITEFKVGQVITQDIVNDYSNAIKTQNKGLTDTDILTDYLKPSKLIDGSFFLKDDKLIFRSSIIDAINNLTLFSFKPIECENSQPFECIELLQQRILGYLITEDPNGLNLDQSPPNYEAYQYWMEAQENFDNKPVYLELLNKAIEADSTYFEASAAKVLYYYNQREFKTFDSLRTAILPRSGISKRQRNLMDHYDALLKGDNKRIYSTVLNEYNIKPFHA